MSALLGVVRYEYRMAVRRWGVWLAFGAAGFLMVGNWLEIIGQKADVTAHQWAGLLALLANGLMPVVGGIAIADRLARDRRLNVRELLWATPLSRRTYVWGKYLGALLATLTPVLAILLAGAGLYISQGRPITFAGQVLVAFLAISVPAYAFVGAFSLACPEVLPVRVYQVLFTGYWFWGNFITPKALPTLNGTLLTARGEFAASAFFGIGRLAFVESHSVTEAALNLVVLGACAAAILIAVQLYLGWEQRKA